MKYLVNRETKEHKVATTLAESIIKGYPDFKDDWQLVEADAEGWIPWEGGDCPLPGWCECEIQTKEGDRLLSREAKRWTWSPNIGDATITHYRPILAEKEEAQPKSMLGPDFDFTSTGKMPYSAHSPSVFDRLKSAIAASESIPGIIAEIDALLPEGYCVAKREAEQPAEDMSDWRNWREGDAVECASDEWPTLYTLGNIYAIEFLGDDHIRVFDNLGQRSSCGFSESELRKSPFRFHSRPAKVAE